MIYKFKTWFVLPAFFLLNIAVANAQTWRGKPVNTTEKYSFYEGFAKVKLDRKWGFIDTLGRVIVKPKYEQVENFSNGLARVRSGHKGWGLVNTKGQEVIKPMFDFIGDFVNGIALVKASGQEGYINTSGKLVKKK